MGTSMSGGSGLGDTIYVDLLPYVGEPVHMGENTASSFPDYQYTYTFRDSQDDVIDTRTGPLVTPEWKLSGTSNYTVRALFSTQNTVGTGGVIAEMISYVTTYRVGTSFLGTGDPPLIASETQIDMAIANPTIQYVPFQEDIITFDGEDLNLWDNLHITIGRNGATPNTDNLPNGLYLHGWWLEVPRA